MAFVALELHISLQSPEPPTVSRTRLRVVNEAVAIRVKTGDVASQLSEA